MNVNVGRQYTGFFERQPGFERVWCVLSLPPKTDRYSLSLSLSINPSFYYLHFTQSSRALAGVRITVLCFYSLTQLCCFIHEQTERFREDRLKESVTVLEHSDLLLNCCVIVVIVCASTWWKARKIFHHINILKTLTHNLKAVHYWQIKYTVSGLLHFPN